MVNLPKWLCGYIKNDEIEKLSEQIRELEKHTSVEIVTMVVEGSSTRRHVFWILALCLYVLLGSLERFYFWNYSLTLQGAFLVAEIIGATTLAWILLKIFPHALTRIFTDDRDHEIQVSLRAQVEFYNQSLTSTANRTGVLIFISILEHQVVVLADKNIAEVLPSSTWQDVVRDLISDLKQKKLAHGLSRAVEHVSKLVTPKFPVQNQNPNELTDYLIIEGVTKNLS